MPLIDFLLENIFFVIVALGFLTSLLAKKKAEEAKEQQARANQQQAANRNREHSLGDEPLQTSRYEREDPFEEERTTYLDTKPELRVDVKPERTFMEIHDDARSELHKQKEKLKGIKDSPIYKEDLLTSMGGIGESRGNAQGSFLSKSDSLPKEAMNGLMWSEVFGPPRAKKPYRGGSYRE
jgi:hemolysin activation/secretion protein